MSTVQKSYPLQPKGSGRGRPRKDGPRYPSGELRPAGPTPELLAHRQAMAADPAMGENPLDAAFANGWLSEAEHRSGKMFATIHRRASLGGPNVAIGHMAETSQTDDPDLQGVRVKEMTDEEIGRVWDQVFGDETPSQEGREAQVIKAMAQYRAINAAMAPDVRNEVFQVCVMDSWPWWIIQRRAGDALRAKAKAESRPLTDAELAYIAKKFATSFERKRTLLINGLKIVAQVLKAASPNHKPDSAIRPMPETPRPVAPINRMTEVDQYVDSEGAPLFVVERRRRR